MPFIAGYRGRLTINGVNLKVNRWSVDWTSENPDVTSLESGPYEGFIAGVKDMHVSFDAFYDDANNPYNDPIGLEPGQYYTILIYYDKRDADKVWNLQSVLCLTAHNEASPRDVPRYTFTGVYSEYRDDAPQYDGDSVLFGFLDVPYPADNVPTSFTPALETPDPDPEPSIPDNPPPLDLDISSGGLVVPPSVIPYPSL